MLNPIISRFFSCHARPAPAMRLGLGALGVLVLLLAPLVSLTANAPAVPGLQQPILKLQIHSGAHHSP
jgi:hypothetical protein